MNGSAFFILNFIDLAESSGKHQNCSHTPIGQVDYDLGNFITKVAMNLHANPERTFHYEFKLIKFLKNDAKTGKGT